MKFRVTGSDEKCASMRLDNKVIGTEAGETGCPRIINLDRMDRLELNVELLKHVD